jgi:hypothetical protein
VHTVERNRVIVIIALQVARNAANAPRSATLLRHRGARTNSRSTLRAKGMRGGRGGEGLEGEGSITHRVARCEADLSVSIARAAKKPRYRAILIAFKRNRSDFRFLSSGRISEASFTPEVGKTASVERITKIKSGGLARSVGRGVSRFRLDRARLEECFLLSN